MFYQVLTNLCYLGIIIYSIKYYLTSKFNFWESRNIPGPRPILGFGTIKDVILIKKSLSQYLMEIYNIYKDESTVGIFVFRKPVLIIKDGDIIKNILIKDFTIFGDRGLPLHEKFDPLSANLLNLEYERWRPLRTKLSTIFSSSKLKNMYSLILESANQLEEYIKKIENPVECRELLRKYTISVVTNCLFSTKTNIFLDEENEFYKIGKSIFALNWKNILIWHIKQYFPWICSSLSYILPEQNRTIFFTQFFLENLNYRNTNNIIKSDIINILRELKEEDASLTNNFLAAQVFLFFAASFETSSITMAHMLYELALNQNIQNRLRQEIIDNLDFTYDNINKLDYLDKVFKETLRKYPAVPEIRRKSRSTYTFNYKGKYINIPKNIDVWIPVYALHMDSNIYPNPHIFDPERFNNEIIQSRHPMYYLPFADGPRNCVGNRFAIYQIKIGIIKILQNYKIEICEKTQIPYIINPNIILILTPKTNIYLKIIPLNLN